MGFIADFALLIGVLHLMTAFTLSLAKAEITDPPRGAGRT
jgi:hypothetical protein